MSSDPKDVNPMVSTYKKLFLILSVVTIIGISVVLLHVPLWAVLLVGLFFMFLKSVFVYESFKNLLIGRNIIIMVFVLTAVFVLGLLLIPVMNHQGYIVGTEDISKQLMMEQSQQEKKHGD